eukprot:Rhum_TRINITY_DN15259_c0_g1::Rhum_TRINITY_DN15259_c0_g1_i1::g.147186::m.147186
MVVHQQLVQEVDGIGGCDGLVVLVDEVLPRLTRVLLEDAVVVRRKLDAVLLQVRVQGLGAQNLANLHQLVVVVEAVEEGFFLEDHAGEHAAQRPHVKVVVVLVEVHKQLRSLEVSARHTHVVLLPGVEELGQSPVDQPQLPLLVVDHHVLRLHVSVRDAHAVAEVQRLQKLIDVVTNVEVGQRRVERAELGVVHVLEDEGRGLRERVAHHVEQLDDVGAAAEVLQDLDLTLDLHLLHGLQNLDHATLLVLHVHTLEHLGVLAPPDFPHHLVAVLGVPANGHGLVVMVLLRLRLVYVHVRVIAHPHVFPCVGHPRSATQPGPLERRGLWCALVGFVCTKTRSSNEVQIL